MLHTNELLFVSKFVKYPLNIFRFLFNKKLFFLINRYTFRGEISVKIGLFPSEKGSVMLPLCANSFLLENIPLQKGIGCIKKQTGSHKKSPL